MHRRRFIQILAGSAASLSLGQLSALSAATLQPVRWQGYTLGAEGRFTLYSDKPAAARAILQVCFAEIKRLEKCFSLYDPNSELCELNRTGHLAHPSSDWSALLDAIDQGHRLSGGLFDPTIQALWQLYAAHFAQNPDTPQGPAAHSIQEALQQTGWQHVAYGAREIHFAQAGMQLSLNGIAQGFITDRIAHILKEAGYQHVLVELGETRAIGPHPEQRPWHIGIKDANQPGSIKEIAELDNQALATSGSYGSTFSKDGHFHHLIHPQTGLPATRWKSLSVIAPTATQADALSTGLSFASAEQIRQLVAQRPELSVVKQG